MDQSFIFSLMFAQEPSVLLTLPQSAPSLNVQIDSGSYNVGAGVLKINIIDLLVVVMGHNDWEDVAMALRYVTIVWR